jgi:uncharacterized integral membrane protein (TIGR00698 family)
MAKMKWSRFSNILFGTNNVISILLGTIVSVIIAVAAYYIDMMLGNFIPSGQSPISEIMIALIIGIIIRNTFLKTSKMKPGINFCIKKLLKLGIVLMGIRLSMLDLGKITGVAIVIVLVCISSAIAFSFFISKKLKISPKLGALIAGGTSICGATAIVAIGPGIEAEDEEITYAIAVITIFGLIVMFAYPYLTYLVLNLNHAQAGIFMGTSIHETAQVVGAGLTYDQLWEGITKGGLTAGDIAIVTKLIRNTFMIIVIPIMIYLFSKNNNSNINKKNRRKSILSYFPIFVIGFIAFAIIRSIGDQLIVEKGFFWNADSWKFLHSAIKNWSGHILTVAMAAVGLNTDLKKLKKLGYKPLVAGFITALFVGLVSLVMIIAMKGLINIL